MVSFSFFIFSFYFIFAWLVLFRFVSLAVFWLLACRTQYDGMIIPSLMHYAAFSLCCGLWPQSLYLSRVKNQHGHWVCWMSTSVCVCVCSSHQTVPSTRRHPAHPLSVLILLILERHKALWSRYVQRALREQQQKQQYSSCCSSSTCSFASNVYEWHNNKGWRRFDAPAVWRDPAYFKQ